MEENQKGKSPPSAELTKRPLYGKPSRIKTGKKTNKKKDVFLKEYDGRVF